MKPTNKSVHESSVAIQSHVSKCSVVRDESIGIDCDHAHRSCKALSESLIQTIGEGNSLKIQDLAADANNNEKESHPFIRLFDSVQCGDGDPVEDEKGTVFIEHPCTGNFRRMTRGDYKLSYDLSNKYALNSSPGLEREKKLAFLVRVMEGAAFFVQGLFSGYGMYSCLYFHFSSTDEMPECQYQWTRYYEIEGQIVPIIFVNLCLTGSLLRVSPTCSSTPTCNGRRKSNTLKCCMGILVAILYFVSLIFTLCVTRSRIIQGNFTSESSSAKLQDYNLVVLLRAACFILAFACAVFNVF